LRRDAETRVDQLHERSRQLRERAEREGMARNPLVKKVLGAFDEMLQELSSLVEQLECAVQELSQANRETEEHARRYADLFRLAPDAYVVTDEHGVVLELNDVAEYKLGRVARLMQRRPMLALVAPADRDAFMRYLEKLRDRRMPLENKVIRFGAKMGFDASISAMAYEHRDRVEIRWILRDVTAHRHTERALRASEARMRTALDVAFDGLLETDARGVIRSSNASLRRMFGYRAGELDGRAVDALGFSREALESIETDTVQEWTGVRQDGSQFPIQVSTKRVSTKASPDGDREIVTGVHDLSAERGLQSQLRAANAATALAEERERQRLASDLHDDVGQLLSLAGIKLGMLQKARGDRAEQLRDELAELVSRAHQRTESLTFQLSPPILRDMGLAPAVEWLAEDIKRSYGLSVHIEHDGEPPIDEATRVTVFRSLRELLINSARHSRAGEASVMMAHDGADLGITIEDRGIGFDASVTGLGFGLISVRERLEALGGHFEIESAVGRGTRAKIAVALAPPGERR
jgi:PAS domain S-box-containing protein